MTREHVRTDCNWLPKVCDDMRRQLREIRLQGVTDIEKRVQVNSELRSMSYIELSKALKAEKKGQA